MDKKHSRRDFIDILKPYRIVFRVDGTDKRCRIRQWSEVPIIIYSARGDKTYMESRVGKGEKFTFSTPVN
jgi:transglutaminase-like putative cysteine protease